MDRLVQHRGGGPDFGIHPIGDLANLPQALGGAGLMRDLGYEDVVLGTPDGHRHAAAESHGGHERAPLSEAHLDFHEFLARMDPVVIEVALAYGLANGERDGLVVEQVGLEQRTTASAPSLHDRDTEGGMDLIAVLRVNLRNLDRTAAHDCTVSALRARSMVMAAIPA
ncbi:hypothetical protein [Streptomyces sp. NBC_00987]|uniref:hypothetical protein n=1 Tax=Streptomyces sp. NBC_00987 TaxID=2903703 RepID=UPI00386A9D3C|nr:hypothetical protein OG355_41455 [Streptomyces sp. NBC_00987]